ncbi:riboflavin synthase [Alkalihalobacillus pseudalcaliphilus]|uniref:riboflavin synthase n=1 Tax=Alkalihalobacillus pseudalcaliphilus TaxID=79884 RepID=UPI00064D7728|nr:riboflavin synthase [Alkalihalobacillus pseudalcaliphilus]KMK76140.1 riboflavin synthase subunit alpha [Alkalihalobacillus pseudalcaliphilus]
MFTGIVEEMGEVQSIRQGQEQFVLVVKANHILEDCHVGDSIAVNGVCLTVTQLKPPYFTADVMPETLKSSNLQQVRSGQRVNLERAMAVNGRFGGHIVSGHVDGTGRIQLIKKEKNAVYIHVDVSKSLTKYMILKGSITVDGISLTIFDVSDDSFTISIIPHTFSQTVLKNKKVGDWVNIECDVLAKYTEKLLSQSQTYKEEKTNITNEFLEKNGFI